MKWNIIVFVICLLFTSCNKNSSENTPEPETPFTDTLKLRFVQRGEASEILKTQDGVTNRWSQLDITVRLNDKNGTKNELLEFVSKQTLDWERQEIDSTLMSENTFNNAIREKGLNLKFPKEVRILKTTMFEEGGAAAYTRDSYIVFSSNINNRDLILAHEIFHVLTRSNPEFRKKMYALIGFNILPEEVQFPQKFRDILYTNPDVIRNDSYATFTINGEKTDCVMVICMSKPYEEGSIFDNIDVRLVAVDKENCKAIEKDGEVVTYSLSEATDFLDKVGKNTSYVLDPEEILAENFCYMITNHKDIQTPELIEKMEKACR